jgi:hypothetical protein
MATLRILIIVDEAMIAMIAMMVEDFLVDLRMERRGPGWHP